MTGGHKRTGSCRVALIALVLLANLPLAALPQEPGPLPESLTDPEFLKGRSWKGDRGLDDVVRNWAPYVGEQGFADKTILKRASIKLLGTVFRAEYRAFKKESMAEIVLIGNEFEERFCATFLDWSQRSLGTPVRLIDLSRTGKDTAWIESKAEWLLGETRVQVSCAGVKTGETFVPISGTLLFRQKDMLKSLEDLIYIECSSTKKYVGMLSEKGTEQGAPVTLIIDPNRGRLLRSDKGPFLKTERYSDDEIVVSGADDERSIFFRLDRIGSSYLMHIRLKKDGQSGLDQWGKCMKITPDRKF